MSGASSDTTTGTVLDEIVADVRRRLAAGEERAGLTGAAEHPLRSLVASIAARGAAGELAVVAEVKRRSPSVGQIAADVDPAVVARAYDLAGAAGISVLTEPDHFGGSIVDLDLARAATRSVPLLRKDFIVEASQLEVARAAGADVVLLIAALHPGASLHALVRHAHDLGLEVLAEVHDEVELDHVLESDADLVGINARDLRTFTVDLGVVEALAVQVDGTRPVVAESGIRTPEDARRVRDAGADAVLVGEALMRSVDPGAALAALAAVGAPEARRA